jgi:Pyridoxamine 5'-phosphate oxidase
MYLNTVLSSLAIIPLVLSSPLDVHQVPIPPSPDLDSAYRIPTRYESTVLGRRLLALTTTGVFSTVFPSHINDSYPTLQLQVFPNILPESDDANVLRLSTPPSSVASNPIGLAGYITDCAPAPTYGDPTLLTVDISTSSRNAAAGSNTSLSVSWWDTYTLLTGRAPYSYAALPRLSLVGYYDEIALHEAEKSGVVDCYLAKHPDAWQWLPGRKGSAHNGKWMRLVVKEVYWFGGYGDRAFIGWLDPAEWKNVTEAEWKKVRLPGEDGYPGRS